MSDNTTTVAATIALDRLESSATGELLCGRYRLVRPLGQGGMSTVHLVLDRCQDYQPVALKRIQRDRAGRNALALLRKEFLTLAPLRHPHLPRAFDFGVEPGSGDLFFTSEYVNGRTWGEVVGELDLASAPDLDVFFELLAQVLRALAFIHTLGKVHGDIKPGNILVARQASAGQDAAAGDSAALIKIIDFGLTRREREFSGKHVLGTPYYVAPETIVGSRIDRRTDLYSVGVVLYQMVTGKPPFRGASNLEVLRSHLEKTPRPPSELAPHLPAAFCAIVERLLAKEPDDRFQTALDVLEAVARACGRDLPLETPATTAAYLERGKLVGNRGKLRALCTAFGRAMEKRPCPAAAPAPATRSPSPAAEGEDEWGAACPGQERFERVVLLAGGPGTALRELVDAFRCHVQTHDVAFLQVECAPTFDDPPASRETLELLLREICAGNGTLPGESAAEYLRLPVPASRGGDEAAHQEELVALTVERLLAASSGTPLVLHFHEIERAGEPVLEVLRRLAERLALEAPGEERLVVTATLVEEMEVGAELPRRRIFTSAEALSATRVISVERLDLAGVKRFLRVAFAGCHFPDAVVNSLCEDCAGNLELVLGTMASLLDQGKLKRVPCGWVLSEECREGAIAAPRPDHALEDPSQLPPEAHQLAAAFACLARPTEVEVAAELAGLTLSSARLVLRLLLRKGLLRAFQGVHLQTLYSFVSSSAREAFYARVPADRRAELHRHAGALWEERGAAVGCFEPQELARHFLLAGDPLRGVHYGLELARELSQEFRPRQAVEVYEDVLRLAAGEDGSSSEQSGRRAGASEPTANATGAADSRLGHAVSGAAMRASGLTVTVSREIANLRFQLGDLLGAQEILAPFCRAPAIEASPRAKCLLYLEAARVEARLDHLREAENLIEQAEAALQDLSGKESEAERVPLLFTRAELLYFSGDVDASLRLSNRILEMADAVASPLLLCDLYQLLAESHASIHGMEVAANYCSRALSVLEGRKENPYLLALRFFFRGERSKYRFRFSKALSHFKLSRLLWRKLGAFDREASTLLEIGKLYCALRRPRPSRALLRRALTLFREGGNARKAIESKCALAEAYVLAGERERSQRLLGELLEDEALERMPELGGEVRLSFAGAYLEAGDLENAGRYLHEAERSRRDRGPRTTAVPRGWLLRSRLAWHRGELGAALEATTRGLRVARELRDPNLTAYLLRQRALLYVALGAVPQARLAVKRLYRLARRRSFVPAEAWAWLLRARLAAQKADFATARKALRRAQERFKRTRGERDRMHFQLEAGLLCLATGDHEGAYVHLEEGLYVARKLNLPYMKGQHFLAMGRLEAALDAGADGADGAEGQLRAAERLATQSGFLELEWSVKLELAVVRRRAGDEAAALQLLDEARAARENVLADLPPEHRETYAALHPCELEG